VISWVILLADMADMADMAVVSVPLHSFSCSSFCWSSSLGRESEFSKVSQPLLSPHQARLSLMGFFYGGFMAVPQPSLVRRVPVGSCARRSGALQRRWPAPAGHVPDLIAFSALKSGARAKPGFAVAVKATTAPLTRSGGPLAGFNCLFGT